MQHLILFISSMSILAFSAPASADTSQSQEEIQKKEERAAERRKQREEREKKREEMRKKQEASMQEWREKTQKLLSKQTIQEALDGDEEAQLDVALICLSHTGMHDMQSRRTTVELARQNHPEALGQIGPGLSGGCANVIHNLYGPDIWDRTKAAKIAHAWAVKAAEAGHPESMMGMANMSLRAAKLEKSASRKTADPDEIEAWAKKAMELGNTSAMYQMGLLRRAQRDYLDAFAWFEAYDHFTRSARVDYSVYHGTKRQLNESELAKAETLGKQYAEKYTSAVYDRKKSTLRTEIEIPRDVKILPLKERAVLMEQHVKTLIEKNTFQEARNGGLDAQFDIASLCLWGVTHNNMHYATKRSIIIQKAKENHPEALGLLGRAVDDECKHLRVHGRSVFKAVLHDNSISFKNINFPNWQKQAAKLGDADAMVNIIQPQIKEVRNAAGSQAMLSHLEKQNTSSSPSFLGQLKNSIFGQSNSHSDKGASHIDKAEKWTQKALEQGYYHAVITMMDIQILKEDFVTANAWLGVYKHNKKGGSYRWNITAGKYEAKINPKLKEGDKEKSLKLAENYIQKYEAKFNNYDKKTIYRHQVNPVFTIDKKAE